jgi:hypothetical protein
VSRLPAGDPHALVAAVEQLTLFELDPPAPRADLELELVDARSGRDLLAEARARLASRRAAEDGLRWMATPQPPTLALGGLLGPSNAEIELVANDY